MPDRLDIDSQHLNTDLAQKSHVHIVVCARSLLTSIKSFLILKLLGCIRG